MPRSSADHGTVNSASRANELASDFDAAHDAHAQPSGLSTPGSAKKAEVAYALYPMRWVALLQLCLLNGGNAAQWIVFGIVIDEAKDKFGMTTAQINLQSASYEIVFAILAPAAMMIYSYLGLRAGLRVASAFNLLGVGLRFVALLFAPSFACLFASQCCLSVTMVCVFAAPPMLAARWFGDDERTLATTIGAMSNSLGLAFGNLIPPLIVNKEHNTTGSWAALFAVQGVYAIVEFALIYFVLPSGPPSPPSAAEEVKGPGRAVAVVAEAANEGRQRMADSDEAPLARSRSRSRASSIMSDTRRSTVLSEVAAHPSTAQQLRSMMRVPAFACLFVVCGLFFGGQWSVIGLLPQLLQPMGVSESTVGWMGFVQILVGITVAIPFGKWIDRVRKYQSPLGGLMIATTVLYNLFATVFLIQPPGTVVVAFVVYVLLGIPAACAIPVIFEYAVELTYPHPESTSTMACMWIANLLTVPLLFGLPAILGDNPTRGSALVALFSLGALAFIASVLVIVPRSKLRRLEYERACAELEEEETREDDPLLAAA